MKYISKIDNTIVEIMETTNSHIIYKFLMNDAKPMVMPRENFLDQFKLLLEEEQQKTTSNSGLMNRIINIVEEYIDTECHSEEELLELQKLTLRHILEEIIDFSNVKDLEEPMIELLLTNRDYKIPGKMIRNTFTRELSKETVEEVVRNNKQELIDCIVNKIQEMRNR